MLIMVILPSLICPIALRKYDLCNCNEIRTHSYLVRKQELNHLAN